MCLPFDPDEVLPAREVFRRLSAQRRAARQKAAEYGPTRVYSVADAPTGRVLPPIPTSKRVMLPAGEMVTIEYERRAHIPPKALPARREMISQRQELRHAREGTKVAALYKIQAGRCYLGGCAFGPDLLPTVDHVKPKAHGGRTAHNILLACGPCNREKADRMPTPAEVAYLRAVNAALLAQAQAEG
jgi:5-methylcytosine-specific restriction endonuclease McrA